MHGLRGGQAVLRGKLLIVQNALVLKLEADILLRLAVLQRREGCLVADDVPLRHVAELDRALGVRSAGRAGIPHFQSARSPLAREDTAVRLRPLTCLLALAQP